MGFLLWISADLQLQVERTILCIPMDTLSIIVKGDNCVWWLNAATRPLKTQDHLMPYLGIPGSQLDFSIVISNLLKVFYI